MNNSNNSNFTTLSNPAGNLGRSSANGRSSRRGGGARVVAAVNGTLPPLPTAQADLAPVNLGATNQTTGRRRRRGRRVNRMLQYTTVAGVPNATRSGLMPNPADPRTTTRILGQTPQGAAWCLKVLHPCGEHDSNVCKIPDGSASESVILERRDEFVVNKPTGTTTPTWSVVIFQHPYLSQSLLAIAGRPSDMTDANIQNAYYLAYYGAPDIASSPDWSDVGNLHASFLDMAVLDNRTVDSAPDDYWEGFFKTIRRSYCGLTIDFDANDLTNKGRVTSGQFQSVVDIRAITGETLTPPDVLTPVTIPVYQVTRPPVVDADIVQEDLLCRQAEAKTGEYAPQRMWQPVIDFVPATAARRIDITGGDESTVIDTNAPKTIWFSGWGLYVSRWDDIDQTSSLRIKRREGLEMVVGRGSPYGPFNTPGNPDDTLAQKVAKEFSRIEPHAYEADYNDKNRMLGGIISGLGNALGNLGIPIVSDLAPMLGNLLGGILPI